ncbi:hypothetical protein [Halomarina pelagica]|uniref:hypothetical protein n=1 Tax=Halomarina pelagica TaxID=2961599 RepID=UPI0020C28C9E|nr:hypothetical protein [Halomarina sp. BND7]
MRRRYSWRYLFRQAKHGLWELFVLLSILGFFAGLLTNVLFLVLSSAPPEFIPVEVLYYLLGDPFTEQDGIAGAAMVSIAFVFLSYPLVKIYGAIREYIRERRTSPTVYR